MKKTNPTPNRREPYDSPFINVLVSKLETVVCASRGTVEAIVVEDIYNLNDNE